jgi:hypothetical protein
VISHVPIFVESGSSEVNKLAAAEPDSSKGRVLLGKLIREDAERVIRVEVEIQVAAAEWRKSPSADEHAV